MPGLASANGQFLGTGCVYPAGAQTIANQLDDSGYTWKGYMQDMSAGSPKGMPLVSCRHPSIGSRDPTQTAHPGDQYAARHNPFVYFHSITDFPTCKRNDVDLRRLPDASSTGARRPTIHSSRPISVPTAMTRPASMAGPAGSRAPTSSCAAGCRGFAARLPTGTEGC